MWCLRREADLSKNISPSNELPIARVKERIISEPNNIIDSLRIHFRSLTNEWVYFGQASNYNRSLAARTLFGFRWLTSLCSNIGPLELHLKQFDEASGVESGPYFLGDFSVVEIPSSSEWRHRRPISMGLSRGLRCTSFVVVEAMDTRSAIPGNHRPVPILTQVMSKMLTRQLELLFIHCR